ncbi:TPM domain-containing protein, partial [Parabacteroides goldsteinii]
MRNLNRILTGKRLPALWLAVLLLVSLFPLQLSAAKDYTVETIPNVRLSDRNNHVSNPDRIIQPQDVDRINRLLQIVEDSLGIEVAVVAVESIGDNDARMFATDLFQHWGLGKKDKDNGLLIQLVTEPTQRSVVFETGYGIEGVLPDAICYRLQQRYMIPDLKAGEYSTGMLKGVAAVKQYLMASDYERAAMTGG